MKSRGPAGGWHQAWLLVNRHRGPLLGALLLVGTSRLAALALPLGSKVAVDEVIGRRRPDLLSLIALLSGAAVVIEAVCAAGAVQLAGAAGQRASAGLRRQLQQRLLGLPLRHLEAEPSGAIAAQAMADSEQARYLVGNGLVQLVGSLITAAVATVLLFRLDAALTLAVMATLGLYTIGMEHALSRLTAAFNAVLRRQSDVTARLAQVVGVARIVKAYTGERLESHRFAVMSHQLAREGVVALRTMAVIGGGSSLLTGVIGVVVLIVGARAVVNGAMSLGDLVMFIWLTGLLLAPIVQVASGAGDLGRAAGALARFAALQRLPTEKDGDRSRQAVRDITGTVDYEHVSFAYEPERLALRDVSLHAPAGSTVAIVGPNGSGKSTLCRLLLAYDVPTRGRVLIDGRDLRCLKRREYRSHIAVVPQGDSLLDGSIVDNIRYGRPSATRAEVLAAARLAHCDEFVAALPRGFATVVGEHGHRLSSGQRQRVAIARAFLVNPRILVLDEATANLDAESEWLVRLALRALSRQRTTFVIAHRLSTVQEADQILVLEAGRIVEQGSHEVLLSQRARYYQRYDRGRDELQPPRYRFELECHRSHLNVE